MQLLDAHTVNRAREPHTDDLDGPAPFRIKSEAPQRFGLGFELPRSTIPMLGEGSFGHPGAGGRLAFASPEKHMAAAYVCTNMLWDGINPDPRWTWMPALNKCVEAVAS